MEPSEELSGNNRPKISRKAAWREYPDAGSAEGACLAETLIKKVWDRSVENTLSKSFSNEAQIAAVLQPWDSLDLREKAKIPNSTKIFLIQNLPHTEEGYNSAANILTNGSLSDSRFEHWQNEHKKIMFRAMDQDPLIAEAKARWEDPSFSIEKKLAVAQHIQNIQAKSFGAQPVPVISFNRAVIDNMETHGYYQKSINGNYSPYIGLNIEEGLGLHRPFKESMAFITHEGTHSLQDQIGRRYRAIQNIENDVLQDLNVFHAADLTDSGLALFNEERERKINEAFPHEINGWNAELRSNGRLSAIASLFEFNIGLGYMDSESAGHKNYTLNPIEQQAHMFGHQASNYLVSDDKDYAIEQLNRRIDYDGESANKIASDRAQTMKSDKLCP